MVCFKLFLAQCCSTGFPTQPFIRGVKGKEGALHIISEGRGTVAKLSLSLCGYAGCDRQRGRHVRPSAGPGRGEPHLRGAADSRRLALHTGVFSRCLLQIHWLENQGWKQGNVRQ